MVAAALGRSSVALPVLPSPPGLTAGADYAARREAMAGAVEKLGEALGEAGSPGSDRAVARAHKAGKDHARARIEAVLDQDSPFLELLPLAGLGLKDNIPGGANVAGIGLVAGVETMVIAGRATIKGGAIDEASVRKGDRLAAIAAANRLPTITFVESGGANLRQQFKVFHAGGASFRDITRRSKAGIPSIAVVCGSCTAGGAYLPGMSDYVIMVKDNAKVFLAGPPLVKMATGEVTTDDELGGAVMHASVSGVADYLAEDELHGIALARSVMATVAYTKATALPHSHLHALPEPPLYNPHELLGIVGTDLKASFDVRHVIARIVDGSRFGAFKAAFGPTLVTGWASIHGIPVGIIANNGPLFSDAANKGAQFIQICNYRSIPLLFLQNITGFMVGTAAEQEGIIRHGAKLINAVSNSTVPAITVIIGASYGAGNYAMCGRAYEPRFLFAWPNSRVAVMGSEQLAGVMDIVVRASAARKGVAIDDDFLASQKSKFIDQVEDQSDCYYVSAHCLDDGIIDPRETRNVVGMALSATYSAPRARLSSPEHLALEQHVLDLATQRFGLGHLALQHSLRHGNHTLVLLQCRRVVHPRHAHG
ncbi:carboxyl transferase [Thecamonas trahens ATCC 50062]|uniref:methylcrotonoyl-CoA carboxylase n=1 Tax=Thecamonas trahens ATCC 50062 TaxID=461836 RepID=A0A0L0DBS0_THETB|nr:carboxyl transferase [Thecamonas trahens ATCC 50062]KNC49541.1 carboxyl transferase [Thecamonas trahens ATCC 50062]|eukprot:XP_013757653.1 carboxyl transferase [Thecamonas trahens ATCC 50062]